MGQSFHSGPGRPYPGSASEGAGGKPPLPAALSGQPFQCVGHEFRLPQPERHRGAERRSLHRRFRAQYRRGGHQPLPSGAGRRHGGVLQRARAPPAPPTGRRTPGVPPAVRRSRCATRLATRRGHERLIGVDRPGSGNTIASTGTREPPCGALRLARYCAFALIGPRLDHACARVIAPERWWSDGVTDP